MKITYVILHYLTGNDTKECINSIINTNLENEYNIIVVDNYSNNGSIEYIEKNFQKLDNFYVIKNKKNYGFAKGNNIGYQYAKQYTNPDFIIVLNNDIIIKDKDFADKIISSYEKTSFYIAGPDVISLVDNHHQSPMEYNEHSVIDINKEILRYYILLFCSYINIYDLLQKYINRNIITKNNKPMHKQKIQENVQLHGSFLIFSPLFIKSEDNAFYPGTFLYMEEAILFQYCQYKKYKTLYDPRLKVFHKEDSATNSIFNIPKKKREFVFKNMIQSLKIYRKVIKKIT